MPKDKIEPTVRARKIPPPEVMQKRMAKFLTEKGDRLVGKSTLKALAKAIDPKIRIDSRTHVALVHAVAKLMLKAMRRTYDNKRGTIRPSDL